MSQHVALMPHAVCWRQDPSLIWTMVATNAITFLSYTTICITLLYLARRTRRVIARDWAYFVVGFALFIVACGSTHLLDVITTWVPIFWVDAWTNIITAVLSGYVAIQFIRRASTISFGINDYAERLAHRENETSQLKENLLSAQKLEEWNRMSTVVTHEINNPLESILNLLYLIREAPDSSPEVIELATRSADEVDRVVNITRSTLSFFRHSSQPENIDLCKSAEAVRFLLGPLLRNTGIELLIHGEGDCTVEAFPGETRQVMLNLIRNACDAITRTGANVIVTLTPLDSGVRITIDDEGSGIDPNLVPRLFQFGVSSKGAQGNGMGLWAVKQILQRHAGTIELEPKEGPGTRFVLFWPRKFSGVRRGEYRNSPSSISV